MAWQRYNLAFRLLSPLHIGYRKVSNLQQTRGYVPGKVLWAALTARLTRETISGAKGTDYEAIGEKVRNNFCFTYLYPALDPAGPSCYPWDDDFTYRFLSSYASTALNYDHQAAAEGSLHEVEFIRPHARPLNGGESSQVYLVGNLYVNEAANSDDKLKHWQEALDCLQLGGERGYGWGRIQPCSDSPKLIGGREDEPQVECKTSETIPAHALATGAKAVTGITGSIEPLVGWERDNEVATRKWRVSQAIICYAPGARVTEDTTFTIGHCGILER
ncbi:MAG TPA: hypothetical protein PKE64_27135 [Anaerolineae bacterium]|nr:hypothetical protein [Anaerolineae bacterium]